MFYKVVLLNQCCSVKQHLGNISDMELLTQVLEVAMNYYFQLHIPTLHCRINQH